MQATRHEFDYLAEQRAVMLTSYRRNGAGVGTPVNIFVEDGQAFVRTYDRSGKAKRMLRNPAVELAPSTMSGRVTGPSVHARARLLLGEEAQHAARAIDRKHRILQGVLVPLFHRLRGYRTLHFELTPV